MSQRATPQATPAPDTAPDTAAIEAAIEAAGDEFVGGGLVRTRAGGFITVAEWQEKRAAAAASKAPKRSKRSPTMLFSVGFALALVLLVVVSLILGGATDQRGPVDSVFSDFGYVVREVSGPGLAP